MHTEADAGCIRTFFTRTWIRGFCKVIAIILSERAAPVTVLPEETPPAAFGTVGMVLNTVDHNNSVCHFSSSIRIVVSCHQQENKKPGYV